MLNTRNDDKGAKREIPVRIGNHELLVTVANTWWKKAKGLIGQHSVKSLLIPNCNWIHTFGMRVNLDIVFLDKDMSIMTTLENVPPGQFLMPVTKVAHTLELPAGSLKKLRDSIERKGD